MMLFMTKRLGVNLLLCAISSRMIAAEGQIKTAGLAEGPQIVSAAELGVGRLVPDVTFTPISGKAFQLSQLKPKSAVVIAFTSTSCPVANRYAPTLAAIEKQFKSQGVRFVFVNPVETDS